MHAIHAHRPRSAIAIAAGATILGLAIVLLLPNRRIEAAAGAAFVVLMVVKHLALFATFASPAAAITARVRARLRPPPARPATPPSPGADGYFRTGEAELHVGEVRVQHEVEALPAERSRRALVDLDAGKRLTIRLLVEFDADKMRRNLRHRYAKRGLADFERVDRFLAGLTGTIAPGDSVVISYDAGAKVTRLTVAGREAGAVEGLEFMRTTWRLWFDEGAHAPLADGLMSALP